MPSAALRALRAAAPCPICGRTGTREIVYRLRPFDVVRCAECGGLARDPLPTDEEMQAYYRDPRYIEGGYFADGAHGDRLNPETEIFNEALDRLTERRRSRGAPGAGRVLDVGAGSGAFLKLARERGWDVEGVELSPELAARAAGVSGANVVVGDFASAVFAHASFDAITMWDVLEHTADPGVVLDRARDLLRPGGVLVVFTIDAGSLFNVAGHIAWRLSLGRMTSPLELLYDKRHNHYFTSKTLATLLGRHGFSIERADTHRAHLGRWLSEPASPLVLAGAAVIDALSVPLGRPYRQLIYCVAS
jgi:2-polyprenyl-3-methyl-5-hydroxy-6-metoxy-1,4-benzoquinol methylase